MPCHFMHNIINAQYGNLLKMSTGILSFNGPVISFVSYTYAHLYIALPYVALSLSYYAILYTQ